MSLSTTSAPMTKKSNNHYSFTYPRLYDKRDLCKALGLIGKGGRIQFGRLRKYFLTDDILKELDIAPDLYPRHVFTFRQCEKMIVIFDLNPADFYQDDEE